MITNSASRNQGLGGQNTTRPASPVRLPAVAPAGRRSGLTMGLVVSAAVPAHQLGQRVDLGGERGAAGAGDPHPGPRAAALVALLHLDQPRLLQHGQVPGQVARGQAERVAQVPEVGPRLGRQKNAPVPAASSTRAGSSTFGSSASRALALPYPGLQPSMARRFATLYRLASSAAPV